MTRAWVPWVPWVVLLVACSSHSAKQAPAPAPDHALHVDVTTDGGRMHARVVGHDVDMAHVPTVGWIGVPMTGSADIAVEITVPIKAGESDFRGATGVLSLSCATCTIGFEPDQLAQQIGKSVAMPRIPIDKLDVQATFGDGRVSIAKSTASVGGADVAIDGHITLAKRAGMSWLAVCVRIPAQRVRDLPPVLGASVGYDGSGAANLKLTGELREPRARGVSCDDTTVAVAPDDPAASALTGSPPAIDPALSPSLDPDIAAQISSTGDHAYTIDRTLVDREFANPTALVHVRIVPLSKDGHMMGFRLFGVRPGSLLAALGIENGDRIKAINGEALSGTEKVLEIYTKLRDTMALHVEIERRGQPVALDYKIK